MTQNKRIFLNVVATYGRSLYVLLIGLFCGRWTLMTLGPVDYGLMGVVGGMAAFVSFINSLLSEAVGRFYAFYVGKAEKDLQSGIENCRKWFSTATSLHFIVATTLIVIGYPVGVFAIERFLTIPCDRVEACIWVWRFTCLSCYIGMVNVPFFAMYRAKQEIAELTIYDVFTTTSNVIFMYYAVNHPRSDWIILLVAWNSLLFTTSRVVMSIRAVYIFQECRFRFNYIREFGRIKEVLYFSGCRLITALALMLNNQGMSVLVNKCLGPIKNAAMNIGTTVATHTVTLSSSLSGAFYPAITNAAGAGDFEKMRSMAFRACCLSAVATLIFAIPLSLEIEEVLVLWLKVPPPESAGLCICALLVFVLDNITCGYPCAIMALGKIGRFNIVESSIWFTVLPMGYMLFKLGMGVLGAGVALVTAKTLAVFVKVYYGKSLAGMDVIFWVRRIFLPIVTSSFFAWIVGRGVQSFFAPSLLRVLFTGLVTELVLVFFFWKLVLIQDDREFVYAFICRKLNLILHR